MKRCLFLITFDSLLKFFGYISSSSLGILAYLLEPFLIYFFIELFFTLLFSIIFSFVLVTIISFFLYLPFNLQSFMLSSISSHYLFLAVPPHLCPSGVQFFIILIISVGFLSFYDLPTLVVVL